MYTDNQKITTMWLRETRQSVAAPTDYLEVNWPLVTTAILPAHRRHQKLPPCHEKRHELYELSAQSGKSRTFAAYVIHFEAN